LLIVIMAFEYHSVFTAILTSFYFVSLCVADTHTHCTPASLPRAAYLLGAVLMVSDGCVLLVGCLLVLCRLYDVWWLCAACTLCGVWLVVCRLCGV
jgi:hypothetical protein